MARQLPRESILGCSEAGSRELVKPWKKEAVNEKMEGEASKIITRYGVAPCSAKLARAPNVHRMLWRMPS